MEEEIVRVHFIFYGAVQHVGFRKRARLGAEAIGVTGWVRNDPSGTVSMELQGSEEQIEQVLDAIDSSPRIVIERTKRQRVPIEPEETGFRRLSTG